MWTNFTLCKLAHQFNKGEGRRSVCYSKYCLVTFSFVYFVMKQDEEGNITTATEIVAPFLTLKI